MGALSPLDGRYRPRVEPLSRYFSEQALIKYRVQVEIYYLIFLSEKGLAKKISSQERRFLLAVVKKFDTSQAEKVKAIEAKINHDVKAVEYFIREVLEKAGIDLSQFVHFGLTSEDVTNLAHGLMLKEVREEVILPLLDDLIKKLAHLARDYKNAAMVARTHGQPAVPTTMGKELIVFATRLGKERKNLAVLPVEGKLNGAVGNFNAQVLAFPKNDWLQLSSDFIGSLGLVPNLVTTQILPCDSYLKIFQSLKLINLILIGLDQDMWRYLSDNYFVQKVEKNQVGSSTMPQKVNPIDFENSEGNLGLANTLFSFFEEKLAISRLQRDLSDSTVKRNFGAALGHCLLGYQSCLAGLNKISLNQVLLQKDLDKHWEIITEGVQTVLRTEGETQAYEKVKTFAQGKKLTPSKVRKFIQTLKVNQKAKRKLLKLSPFNYLGLAPEIVKEGLKILRQR